MDNPPEASNSLEEKLIRSGGFNPDDLMFNQTGELSPRQKRWLTLEIAAWAFQVGLDLVLMVCAWLFCYFQFRQNLQLFVVGGLFWSLALGSGAFLCIKHAQPVWADLQSNEVKSVLGIISKHYGHYQKGAGWTGVEIRDHRFNVDLPVYVALVDRQTYRLFYLSNMQRLINIEPLPQAHAETQSALAALQARAREKGKRINISILPGSCHRQSF